MFEKSKEELAALGADITTAEIAQQPDLWRDTLNIYRTNLDAIEAFLADARAMGEGRLSVVFTGAGTSDYVGDTAAPYLRHAGDVSLYDFKPVATTDIVSAPRDFLNPDEPTLLVSFARSGNRPESLPQHHLRARGPSGRRVRRRPVRAHPAHPARQRQGLRHDRLLQLHDAALHPHLRLRLS